MQIVLVIDDISKMLKFIGEHHLLAEILLTSLIPPMEIASRLMLAGTAQRLESLINQEGDMVSLWTVLLICCELLYAIWSKKKDVSL